MFNVQRSHLASSASLAPAAQGKTTLIDELVLRL
jgi:hypothetical protein